MIDEAHNVSKRERENNDTHLTVIVGVLPGRSVCPFGFVFQSFYSLLSVSCLLRRLSSRLRRSSPSCRIREMPAANSPRRPYVEQAQLPKPMNLAGPQQCDHLVALPRFNFEQQPPADSRQPPMFNWRPLSLSLSPSLPEYLTAALLFNI